MISGNIFPISVIGIKQTAKRLSVRKVKYEKKYRSQAVNAFCHV